MLSILSQFEQVLRLFCVFFYSSACITVFLIEPLFRPLYPWIARKSNGYFSKGWRFSEPYKYITRVWTIGVVKILGINAIVENTGEELPTSDNNNAIVMFTHGSNFDPPLLHAYFPLAIHYVAKKSLFKVPFFGKALKSCNQIPIDRSNLASAIEALAYTGQMITDKKLTVGISPEGSRRRKPSMGPEQEFTFKKGPFHLAKTSKVDIIPAVIIGASRLWPAGQKLPRAGTVVIRFCPKVSAKDVENLSIEEIQARVKTAFTENISVIDDKVIFSPEGRPYLMFLSTLVGVILTWTFLVKLFVIGFK